jgi:hypothetical protein
VSGDAVDPAAPAAVESRVGRRAGVALGIVTVVGLVVLAGFGFTPALYLLVLAVVGTLMVVVGARLH